VVRSHYGNGFAKQYVRDDRLLRTEPATNNVRNYGVNRDVENLPRLRDKMSAIIDNYHNVQQDILETRPQAFAAFNRSSKNLRARSNPPIEAAFSGVKFSRHAADLLLE